MTAYATSRNTWPLDPFHPLDALEGVIAPVSYSLRANEKRRFLAENVGGCEIEGAVKYPLSCFIRTVDGYKILDNIAKYWLWNSRCFLAHFVNLSSWKELARAAVCYNYLRSHLPLACETACKSSTDGSATGIQASYNNIRICKAPKGTANVKKLSKGIPGEMCSSFEKVKYSTKKETTQWQASCLISFLRDLWTDEVRRGCERFVQAK